jgi:hypothetical protein
MHYLVQLRSQGGDREDFWPVASYLIDIPAFPTQDAQDIYAQSITDSIVKAGLQDYHDYFATVEALDAITGDAASARDQIVADIAEFLNEDDEAEDEPITLTDLSEALQREHLKFMQEIHKQPNQPWDFNASYLLFLQRRVPLQGE